MKFYFKTLEMILFYNGTNPLTYDLDFIQGLKIKGVLGIKVW
jgi:hypothetical protein